MSGTSQEDFGIFHHEIDLSDEPSEDSPMNMITLSAHDICVQDTNVTNQDIAVKDEFPSLGMAPVAHIVGLSEGSFGPVLGPCQPPDPGDKDEMIKYLKAEIESQNAKFAEFVKSNDKNVNAARDHIIKVEKNLKQKITAKPKS